MLARMLVYVCIMLEYGYFECLRVYLCMYVSCLRAAIGMLACMRVYVCIILEYGCFECLRVCLCMYVSCLMTVI
jgi:hypothetical protein